MKECKRHKWRVGSQIAELINGKLVTTKLNIWCEKCSKVIKANYYSVLFGVKTKQNQKVYKRRKR